MVLLFPAEEGGRFALVDPEGVAVECEGVGSGGEGMFLADRGTDRVPAKIELVCDATSALPLGKGRVKLTAAEIV